MVSSPIFNNKNCGSYSSILYSASVDEDGCMVDWVPSYAHESEHLLKKNGLLTTLPSLGKEWRLTFEIKPTSYTYRSYAQVVQMIQKLYFHKYANVVFPGRSDDTKVPRLPVPRRCPSPG